jgi:cation transport ATPase
MTEIVMENQSVSQNNLRDKWALALSFICIAQCLALPLVASALPMMNIWWLSDAYLHPFMLMVVIPLTFFALVPSYRAHQDKMPLIIAVPAILLLAIGAFIPESLIEKLFTIGGAAVLATAHIINIRLSRALKH